MEFSIPDGWTQDSHTLYLHPSGVRIERRIYRQREGWVLVPVDLDQAVAEFSPNSDGLALAFAAFTGGMFNPKAATPKGRAQLARETARRNEEPEDASDDEENKKEEEGDED
jgi:hypothetical protein